MAQGGYQPPSNPAPVSGPGALSKRTDRQLPMALPDPAYGEGKEFMDIQQGAPMPQASRPAPMPLTAPTQHPDEPLTAGSPFGAGPNGLPAQPRPRGQLAEKLLSAAAHDRSGYAGYMAQLAEALGL